MWSGLVNHDDGYPFFEVGVGYMLELQSDDFQQSYPFWVLKTSAVFIGISLTIKVFVEVYGY